MNSPRPPRFVPTLTDVVRAEDIPTWSPTAPSPLPAFLAKPQRPTTATAVPDLLLEIPAVSDAPKARRAAPASDVSTSDAQSEAQLQAITRQVCERASLALDVGMETAIAQVMPVLRAQLLQHLRKELTPLIASMVRDAIQSQHKGR